VLSQFQHCDIHNRWFLPAAAAANSVGLAVNQSANHLTGEKHLAAAAFSINN